MEDGTEPREKARPEDVRRLHRIVGGDARREEMILRWIAARYGARSLIHLPREVAAEAAKRPWDFVRAAEKYFEPELFS